MIIFTMKIEISNGSYISLIALYITFKINIIHKRSPQRRQIENLDDIGKLLHILHF